MPGRQAGSPIAVQYMREYNAESQKQGRKRFNSVVKTIGFGHLVIIYQRPIQLCNTVLLVKIMVSHRKPCRPCGITFGNAGGKFFWVPDSETGFIIVKDHTFYTDNVTFWTARTA